MKPGWKQAPSGVWWRTVKSKNGLLVMTIERSGSWSVDMNRRIIATGWYNGIKVEDAMHEAETWVANMIEKEQ